MLAAARKVKRESLDASVTEPFCILLPRPTTSPSRTVTDTAVRPSQLAENGIVGTIRCWTGDGEALACTGAGAAFNSLTSRRFTSAFTVMVATPLRSLRKSASPLMSLAPTFSVVTSTLKPLRCVDALAFSV